MTTRILLQVAWASRPWIVRGTGIPPVKRARANRTTRISSLAHAINLLLATLILFALFGCATPGPLHLYTAPDTHPSTVLDSGGPAPIDVPTFLAQDELLTGLAYDPFTDHLFLRLAPGNLIRVVDRPARAVKRTYPVSTLPTTGGGDLAVRPRDGRIFFTDPTEPALILTDRFGNPLGRIALATLTSPPLGVAYDSSRNELLVLTAPDRVTTHRSDGSAISSFTLERPVSTQSLAFDSETQELYAPLAQSTSIGVFNRSGQLLRAIPTPATFLDLGPRSLLRLF